MGLTRHEKQTLRCGFVALRNDLVFVIQPESNSGLHSEEKIFMYSIMISLLRVSTSESMIPMPCF